jgi:hypothetical protein
MSDQIQESTEQKQDKLETIQVFNNYCLITSNVEEIPQFLQKAQKHCHVFLINPHTSYNHPKVSNLKYETIDEYARIIYKNIFDERILHILVDDSDEFCMKIKDKVVGLVNLDKGFCFGQGGINSIVNLWQNLPQIIESPNTTGLKDLFKGKPVVLVNSGPSLSKNIDVLKEYQDKCVIIACSTAITALYKHGITPHFLMIIDPFPIFKEFVFPYCTEKTTLLASSVASYDFIKDYPGKVIFYHTSGGLQIIGNMFRDLNITEGIYSSATVTTAAFSLALYFGADPIIFIGQDMCYGDSKNKVYADGIEGLTDLETIEMETIDGRKVRTIHAYKEIFDYFNSNIPKQKDRTVINATEGGAGLLGAKVMTLQETADQYFIDKVEIPEIKIFKEVDKNKILEDLNLIKTDVIKLKDFSEMFRKYIDSLIENKIDEEFIKVEIDEFFDRLRDKKGSKCIDSFCSWIWYLLPMTELEEKMNSFDLLDNSFNNIMNLLNKQIEILEDKLGIRKELKEEENGDEDGESGE